MKKRRVLKRWVEDLLILITVIICLAICSLGDSIPIKDFTIFSLIGLGIGILNAFIVYKYGRRDE